MAPVNRTAALRLLAAPVSGALLAAAFPALDLGPLALVALVPLLLVVETVRPRQAAAFGYLAGLTFFGLHLLWIAQFLSWTARWPSAWGALAHSAPRLRTPSSPCPGRPASGGVGCCPAGRLGGHEMLGPTTRSCVPWACRPQTARRRLLRPGRVVGGSAWPRGIVAVKQPSPSGSGPVSGPVRRGAAGGGELPWSGCRCWRGLLGARLAVPAAPAASGTALDVVVVQAGLRGGHGLAQGQTTEQVFANHVRRTETLALTPGAPPDLVVWGEGAADADPLSNPDRQAAVARAAAAAKAPILLGATTRLDQDHLATEGLLYTPEGQLADRYQKRRLVPFGEFVPFGSVLGRLIPATREGVPYDKVPGQRLEPLLIDGVRVGPLICWESAYPGDARQLTRDGSQVLLIMTNNASFGTGAGPRQHLAAGQLRAVETGRTIVQAAVTGISTVIGPTGRTSSETGLYQDTVLRVQAEPRSGTTPYVRHGRLLEAGLVGVAVGGLVLAGALWWRRRPEVVGRPAPAEESSPARWDVAPPVGGKP